ncbi:MAG TPA: class I SAM-dependent methyltransferase [Stellaceae bacterium]|nr:class I SAM-dependent methyltransferase [Stellaceae bacterium]
MGQYNLLRTVPNIQRDVSARTHDKQVNRAAALKFGVEYFDGPREQGYGGYRYDGRWVAIAQDIIGRYGLKPGDRVLDIGCAKGFLVKDLVEAGIDAQGLDISAYALEASPPEMRHRLHLGNALSLPFADHYFDAVLCINTIHNLDRGGCLTALREINRVLRRPEAAFVQVDAFTSPEEKSLFEDWCLTALTYLQPEEWVALFHEAGYVGDYYWTILRLD